ncbi:hypothetical protein A1359_14345 [Methylomonas lenta]|uniref:Type I restriction modification DNA specificity domain-containing protein n=1 Tax=Methylomonas lenta TaxID=980561 RepID=A0A177N352_9GAMM|nr:restriction endonuclease subunit S [Methylomonas lenta]OAI11599.1 hypothetical protein A1359_14345 [Methylomonas lenta]
MKYPAYPQYKDSGVTWMGAVPEDWDVKKTRYLAYMKGGSTPLTTENQFWDDGDIPWVSPKDMKTGRITDTQDHLTPEGARQCASGILAPGHVLIVVRSGILKHSLPVAVNDIPVTLNQDIRAFKLGKQLGSEYLRWFIEGNQKLLLEQWCKSGTTVESIEMSYLADGLVPVPPHCEQTAIAAFLDSETGRIDTLVAKKRKLAALLKEKRSGLISRTVTRGLPDDAAREFGLTTGNASIHEAPDQYNCRGDFNRPQAEANKFAPTSEPGSSQAFKDSGVDWLGEIPTNWLIPPLYSRYSIELGKMLNESKITGQHLLPYLRNVDVQWDSINLLELPEMDIPESEYSRYTVQEGDLLVCEGGEVGRAAIIGNLQTNIGFQKSLHRMRALNSLSECPRYMYYLLYWANKTGVFNSGGISTIAHLTGQQLRKFRFPKPPFEEQTAIAAYLDRETAKIDRMVEKVEAAIACLQEYRSALITAAVTGKIDVRAYSTTKVTR